MKTIHILLSFKDNFANLIYTGEKKYEIRKSRILNVIPDQSRAYIYESAPRSRITGLFMIGNTNLKCVEDSLNEFIFDTTTRKYVNSIDKSKEIFIIEVLYPYKLEVAVDPKEIEDFIIPQSFRYLTTQEIDHIHQYNKIDDKFLEDKELTLESWL